MTNAALAPSADPRRWRALTVSMVGAFMVLLDVSIVNVALPTADRADEILRLSRTLGYEGRDLAALFQVLEQVSDERRTAA
jgi:hypothetical protein